MKKNFTDFFKERIAIFLEAFVNFFLFLVYYFSVSQLLSTLFSPWKNLVSVKTRVGFSLDDWFNRFSFNAISRMMGFFIRTFTLIAYLIIEIFYVFLLFPGIILYVLAIPIMYIFDKPKNENDFAKEKAVFMTERMLDSKNQVDAQKWFEYYREKYLTHIPWYSKEVLFSSPPLARDWDFGYTPVLDNFGTEIDSSFFDFRNLVDRIPEIKKIEQILTKAEGNNIFLVGDEGVGRMTIIAALAKSIYNGKINPLLSYKRIFKVDMEKIFTTSGDSATRLTNLKELFKEAVAARNLILLIDDVEKYLSADFGNPNISSILEEFVHISNFHVIGITTPFFYQKIIYPNEKLNKLFEKIDVAEITKEQAKEILLENTFDVEREYPVTVTLEAINEIVEKSDHYITNIPFPEKAIDLLHTCCSYLSQNKTETRIILVPDVVDTVLSEKTHIPVSMSDSFKKKLVNLDAVLKERVIHQDRAIDELTNTIMKSFVKSETSKKPIASFLFLGPTGVGKTETAKALSFAFFDTENQIVRADMSFYQTKEDMDKLLGSIDTKDPGILTAELRQKPYCVLLLDEFEKANKDLLNIFLTALDEGYLVDAWGKKIDIKNTIIIATSNAKDEHFFAPELLNRFDGVVHFNSLSIDAIFEIAKRIIDKIVASNKADHELTIRITDEYIMNLVKNNYNEAYGARDIARIIAQNVESKIAKYILENKQADNKVINFN